jgi:site-specific recombinase XerD
VRSQLRWLADQAGIRRRFAPHQLRHAHAVELAREGVPLNVIQRELGHTNLGVTSTYLQGIDKRRDDQHDPHAQASDDPRHRRTDALIHTLVGTRPLGGRRSRAGQMFQPWGKGTL